MANIQKCQARNRVGAMKVRGIKGIKKPRTVGEVFILDLDIPDEKAAYLHLIANGGIKPIGEAVKTEAKTTGREAVPEMTEPPSAPIVDEPEPEQSARTCKECKLFNTEDCAHDDPDADAVDRYCFVPVDSEVTEPEIIESEPVPEVEAIGPDTLLAYILDFHREEIEFLTEEQIDSLRRIGVATVANINIRTDQELKSLQGIGKSKIRQLRELYDRFGAVDG